MPTGIQVANAALALLAEPMIPYVLGGETPAGMDCQGLVEYCVRQSGGQMSYAGSNDMYRNACYGVWPLATARSAGYLTPGAALFILKQDGGEPDGYKADGLGNASHVGLYVGAPDAEVVHASSSHRCVAASTLQNGWTHVGLLKAVDYKDSAQDTPDTQPFGAWHAYTAADTGTSVNMRETPGGKYMLKIPLGVMLEITERREGWGQTSYGGFAGWVDEKFLRFVGEADTPGSPGEPTDTIEVPRSALEDVYKALSALLGVDG